MSDNFVTKADLTEAITAFETRLLERMDALAERVETRLLTEFHKYALASGASHHGDRSCNTYP